MSNVLLEIHNFLTSPLTDYFVHRHNCPLSVSFGTYFYDYFYLWFAVLFISWASIYYVFKKVMQILLIRMGLTQQRARRVASALWASGAGVGAALLSASQLDESRLLNLRDIPAPHDTSPPPHLAMYLMVLAACQAQRFMASCMRRGFTRHSLADLLQFAILPAAYVASWPEFAFSVWLILSLVQTVCEFARMGLSFRKGRHIGTSSLFVFYCAVWCFVYLVSLPGSLVAVVTTPMESQQHRAGLAFLFVTLTGHILTAATFSPIVPALRGYARGEPAMQWLQSALFPGTDEALLKIKKQAKEKRDSLEAISAANLSRKNSAASLLQQQLYEQQQQRQKQKTDAKALIQTVRCVTLLKRKIRTMREKKAQLVETTSSPLTE